MKYLKTFEKHITLDLDDNELFIGKLGVQAFRDSGTHKIFYNITITINILLKLENYTIFKQFFDIFYDNKIEFRFHDKSFVANVHDNITSIIDDLELIKNTKNYNL